MQDRDKNPDPRAARWSRFSRTAAFWVLIILIPLLIVHVFNNPRQQQAELPYTTYTQQLADHNIAEVTIIDGKRLEGKLRQPVQNADRPVREFFTLLPIKDDPAVLAELRAAQDVQVNAALPRANWWIFLFRNRK